MISSDDVYSAVRFCVYVRPCRVHRNVAYIFRLRFHLLETCVRVRKYPRNDASWDFVVHASVDYL